MTVNSIPLILEGFLGEDEAINEALRITIKALEELEQYRALGTVEELKEAREKQVAKKPTFVDVRFRNHGKHVSDGCSLDKCYKCPNCNTHIFHVWDSEEYCEKCGQKLDWEEGGTSD